MMNSHKLFILVIVLNIVMGIAQDTYYRNEYSATRIDVEIERALERSENVMNQDLDQSSTATLEVGEVPTGNIFSMGYELGGLLVRGMNPFPPVPDNTSNIELIIWTVLAIFRSFLYILIAVEVYFIFKNKKTQ